MIRCRKSSEKKNTYCELDNTSLTTEVSGLRFDEGQVNCPVASFSDLAPLLPAGKASTLPIRMLTKSTANSCATRVEIDTTFILCELDELPESPVSVPDPVGLEFVKHCYSEKVEISMRLR